MCQVDDLECHSGAGTQAVAEIPGSVATLPFSSNASKELIMELDKLQDSEQHAWKERFKRNPLVTFVCPPLEKAYTLKFAVFRIN